PDGNVYLMLFQAISAVVLVGVLFAHIGKRHRLATKALDMKPVQPLPSGTPAQMIQSVVDDAFCTFHPRYIQLLVDEIATGRTFIWHAEVKGDPTPAVHSEEFDQMNAAPYLCLMPPGDWILSRSGSNRSLHIVHASGERRTYKEIPPALTEHFKVYSTVV